MWWLALGLACLLVVAASLVVWRKWVAPWWQIQELTRQIAQGERPRTFLVDGGLEAKKVGLALDNIFARQEPRASQNAGRESGTQTILRAMQDGLLVVDRNRWVTLVNEAFRQLFRLSDISLG